MWQHHWHYDMTHHFLITFLLSFSIFYYYDTTNSTSDSTNSHTYTKEKPFHLIQMSVYCLCVAPEHFIDYSLNFYAITEYKTAERTLAFNSSHPLGTRSAANAEAYCYYNNPTQSLHSYTFQHKCRTTPLNGWDQMDMFYMIEMKMKYFWKVFIVTFIQRILLLVC